jgi:glucosamine--fructose-6-phosphate aminotransferase (isomerizing)
MCGIVGYIGAKDSVPIIMGSLRWLEYRGYDSAGIVVIEASGGGSFCDYTTVTECR